MKTTLMNTGGQAALRMKKFLAIVFLLSLVLSIGPLGSGPIGSVASVQAAQTTRHRRRRRHRTFWQKHRDKLTVAGTTGGGAAIGAIAGGGKGAAIGSLVGAGRGALYTYKIRKRKKHRSY